MSLEEDIQLDQQSQSVTKEEDRQRPVTHLHRHRNQVFITILVWFLLGFLVFLIYQSKDNGKTKELIFSSIVWGCLMAANFKFSEIYKTTFGRPPTILTQAAFYTLFCLF